MRKPSGEPSEQTEAHSQNRPKPARAGHVLPGRFRGPARTPRGISARGRFRTTPTNSTLGRLALCSLRFAANRQKPASKNRQSSDAASGVDAKCPSYTGQNRPDPATSPGGAPLLEGAAAGRQSLLHRSITPSPLLRGSGSRVPRWSKYWFAGTVERFVLSPSPLPLLQWRVPACGWVAEGRGEAQKENARCASVTSR